MHNSAFKTAFKKRHFPFHLFTFKNQFYSRAKQGTLPDLPLSLSQPKLQLQPKKGPIGPIATGKQPNLNENNNGANQGSTSLVEAGSQFLQAFKGFIKDNGFVINAWISLQQQGRLYRYKDTRKVLNLVRDWKLLIPASLLILLPGTVILLPATLALMPNCLPSWMGRVEKVRMYRESALRKHRSGRAEKVRNVYTQLVRTYAHQHEKILLPLAQDPTTPLSKWIYALPHLQTLLQTTPASIKLSQAILEYLSGPVAFSALWPQARILKYGEWVLVQLDGLVQRQGVGEACGGDLVELREMLWERGYIVPKDQVNTVKALEHKVTEHLNTTQKLVKALHNLQAPLSLQSKSNKAAATASASGDVLDLVLVVFMHVIFHTPRP